MQIFWIQDYPHTLILVSEMSILLVSFTHNKHAKRWSDIVASALIPSSSFQPAGLLCPIAMFVQVPSMGVLILGSRCLSNLTCIEDANCACQPSTVT